MDRIWPNGKVRKSELLERHARVQRLLEAHRDPAHPLRLATANQLADALGCLTKCLIGPPHRALDAAENAAAETAPEPVRGRMPFTLTDLEGLLRDQRASLPSDEGHPKDGWP